MTLLNVDHINSTKDFTVEGVEWEGVEGTQNNCNRKLWNIVQRAMEDSRLGSQPASPGSHVSVNQ